MLFLYVCVGELVFFCVVVHFLQIRERTGAEFWNEYSLHIYIPGEFDYA